jgi:hypothetical protein
VLVGGQHALARKVFLALRMVRVVGDRSRTYREQRKERCQQQ